MGTMIANDHWRAADFRVLTERSKARHPNAGRLLANYIMSAEGNKVFNVDPGLISVYDTSRLPRQYELPKPTTEADAARIALLFGFN